MQYTPKKDVSRPPKNRVLRKGERRPAHTPTHINIKQNLTAARRLAKHKTQAQKTPARGKTHTSQMRQAGEAGSQQPAAQQKRSGSSLCSTLHSYTYAYTVSAFCLVLQQINNELSDLILQGLPRLTVYFLK